MVRRQRAAAIEMRAVILVATDRLHARRIRILPVLRNPEPSARVETEVRRLRHDGSREEQLTVRSFPARIFARDSAAAAFPAHDFLIGSRR